MIFRIKTDMTVYFDNRLLTGRWIWMNNAFDSVGDGNNDFLRWCGVGREGLKGVVRFEVVMLRMIVKSWFSDSVLSVLF
jgi:hypothetical protein